MKFLIIMVLIIVCVVTYVQISSEPDPAVEREKAQLTSRGAVRMFAQGAIKDDVEQIRLVSRSTDAQFAEAFLQAIHQLEEETMWQVGQYHAFDLGSGGNSFKVMFMTEEGDLMGSYTFILEEHEGKWWVNRATRD